MAIEEVTRKAVAALKRARVPYVLVGGMAVNYYGFPRATIDIDFLIALEDEQAASSLVGALKKLGFKLDEREVGMARNLGNRFTALWPGTGQRLDFWLAKTKADKGVLKRGRTVKIFGVGVKICSPEDLLISKLRIGRARDLEDALGIVHRQKGRLRVKRLIQRAEALGLARELRKLLKEAGLSNEH